MRYLTKHIIIVSLLVALSLVTTALDFRPRTVPLEECSELYQRYADNPDINAAYVKNYRVNDTLTLCATILEAANDTGWIILQNDFCFTPYPPEVLEIIEASGVDKSKIVEIKGVLHGTTCGPMDNVNKENNDVVSIYHFNRYIVIIDIKSNEQVDAIFYKYINQIETQKNEKTFFTCRISNYALHNDCQLSEREFGRTHVRHNRGLYNLRCEVHNQWRVLPNLFK